MEILSPPQYAAANGSRSLIDTYSNNQLPAAGDTAHGTGAVVRRIHFVGVGRIEDAVILGQYRPLQSDAREVDAVFTRLLKCSKHRFEAGQRYSFNWKNDLHLTLNIDQRGMLLCFMVVERNYPERLRFQFIEELLRRAELFVQWEYDNSWKLGSSPRIGYEHSTGCGTVLTHKQPTSHRTAHDDSVKHRHGKKKHARSSKSHSAAKAGKSHDIPLQDLLTTDRLPNDDHTTSGGDLKVEPRIYLDPEANRHQQDVSVSTGITKLPLCINLADIKSRHGRGGEEGYFGDDEEDSARRPSPKFAVGGRTIFSDEAVDGCAPEASNKSAVQLMRDSNKLAVLLRCIRPQGLTEPMREHFACLVEEFDDPCQVDKIESALQQVEQVRKSVENVFHTMAAQNGHITALEERSDDLARLAVDFNRKSAEYCVHREENQYYGIVKKIHSQLRSLKHKLFYWIKLAVFIYMCVKLFDLCVGPPKAHRHNPKSGRSGWSPFADFWSTSPVEDNWSVAEDFAVGGEVVRPVGLAALGGLEAEVGDSPTDVLFANGGNTAAHAVGDSAHAVGDSAHAVGDSAHAVGDSAHAVGDSAHAVGDSAHAVGDSAHAVGDSAHAVGDSAHAVGDSAHAVGDSAHAVGDSAHAVGEYASVAVGGLGGLSSEERHEAIRKSAHDSGRAFLSVL